MPTAAPVHRPLGHKTRAQQKAQIDQHRGTTAQRGYDGAWQKLSREYRAQHPYCECDVHQGKDERALSQVVDHRITIRDRPDLRLEWSNLRAMTKACHDRHTALTQGFAKGRQGAGRALGTFVV